MTFTEQLDLKGIEWHPGGKEGEISICCPFCHLANESEDTKFRLGINVITKKAHCFNCEWGSTNNTFDKVLEGLDIEIEEEQDNKKNKLEKKEFDGELPESFEKLWPLKKDIDFRKAYNYLRNRRITDRQIDKYNIGFCLAGKYSDRIIFPVYIKDELKCFIGRDFTEKQELRYKNSIGKKYIYGLYKTWKDKVDTAIIVEGAIDKLSSERVLDKEYKVHSIGIPGRVLKDHDIELLKERGYRKIIRIPDVDGPGLRGTLKDARKLKEAGFDVYISFLDDRYKDINKAFCKGDEKAIKNLICEKQLFTYSLEMKIRTMLATEYRGSR